MSRLLFTGFEAGDTTSRGFAEGGATGGGNAQTAVVTTTPHGGSYCLRCLTTSSLASAQNFQPGSFAVGSDRWVRFYVRKSANPANQIELASLGGAAIFVKMNTSGQVGLFNTSGTQIGSFSSALSDATWYRIEFYFNIGATTSTGKCELRVDGSTITGTNVTNANLGTAAQSTFTIGWNTAAISTATILFDDIAINDAGGSIHNTWPDEGFIVHLLPTGDSAVGTGWTLGTGTATGGNAFAAVDNLPPLGVADLAAGSDPKQLRNAANAANSDIVFNMETYTAKGLVSTDTITVLQPGVITGAPSGTSPKAVSLGMTTNPVGTIQNLGNFYHGVTVAGTYSTGWAVRLGSSSDAIAVTPPTSANYGTAPTVTVRQVTGSTRIGMVSAVYLRVEYQPAGAPSPTSLTFPSRTQRNFLLRR